MTDEMRREEGGHPFLLSKGTVPRVLCARRREEGSNFFSLDKRTVRRVLMYQEKEGRQSFLSIRQRESYTTFDVPGTVSGNLFIQTVLTVEGQSHSLSIVSVSL